MSKWPSLLCAIHCVLAPLLTALVGSASAAHHHGPHEEHAPAFWEVAEHIMIGAVFLVLVYTLVRVRRHAALLVTGMTLMAGLVLALFVLPHGWHVPIMLSIAGYQLVADRRICSVHGHSTSTRASEAHNLKENPMKILFITGMLGAGKTSLLIRLLLWLQAQDELPPFIVNDRGTSSNLDFARVIEALGVPEAEAYDLLGQCIGCGGKEQFLEVVRRLQQEGRELLVVEPTGLFTIGELKKLAGELEGCSVRSIHLVPLSEVQAALSVGLENVAGCRLIGLTHARGDVTAQVGLLHGATGKPVEIVEEDLSVETLTEIWGHLIGDHGHPHEHAPGHGASCSHSGCGHDHDHDHEHAHVHGIGGHRHKGEPFTVTFSTQEWQVGELLGYLVSLGSNLVRFKGVVKGEEGLLQIDWAHGSWSQRRVGADADLKADLFTRERVERPSRMDLTDDNIRTLVRGVPPVLAESPTGGFTMVDAVGPTAWTLLYEQSKRASEAVRRECGQQLAGRCREAATFLVEGDRAQVDPRLLDYTRLQTVMVWLWWNQEFRLELADSDRDLVARVLAQIDPDLVDAAALKPWMGESYRYLPRVVEQFPDCVATIASVEKRMLAA